jgi:hypothetical protein
MGKKSDPGSGINIRDPQHCSVPHPRKLPASFLEFSLFLYWRDNRIRQGDFRGKEIKLFFVEPVPYFLDRVLDSAYLIQI